MDLQLHNKVALVAGGSAGLGLGCAKALAAEGVRVALASRSAEKLESALSVLPSGCLGYQADLSDHHAGSDLIGRVTKDFGRLDILVANAGGPKAGGYRSVGISDYRAAMEQNFLAMAALCNGAIPAMAEFGFGRIIAITSLYVKAPEPNLILSNTARSALTAYLKSVATEVAPLGITVNSLLPGLHRTERLERLSQDLESLAATVPVNKIGDAESFGKIAAFLASEHAWYITGQAILVDGGKYSGLF